MQPANGLVNNSVPSGLTGRGPAACDAGVILVDMSFNVVGCDRAAATIFNGGGSPESSPALENLPREIMDALRSRKITDLPAARMHVHRNNQDYICRAHVMESTNGPLQPLIVLCVEKDQSVEDTADELGAKYNLTEREQEALRGILMGLSSKEVAERMNISPNTVKAFLRLIMIKMGVTTRAGIVARVLEKY